MSDKRKVVITGACGKVSSLLIPELSQHYDLTLIDVKPGERQGEELENLITADLVDQDRDQYRQHFAGADTIIHNGFFRTGDNVVTGDYFQPELANVQMAYNIYRTAWEEGVRRVIMTSSNHAADYYERLLLDGKMDTISHETQNRSYAWYGWAKDAYEHMGFVFALGEINGKPLENVQIRIGAPREDDIDRCELGDLRKARRALATYISQRDLCQLYIKSIECEDIRDKQGIPFQIFYGISGNNHAFWSLVNAREVIGYEPQDNSDIRFRDKWQKHIEAADHTA